MARRELDKYFTAKVITTSFLKRYLPIPQNPSALFQRKTGLICEPCSGDGGMAQAIKEHFPWATVITNDIRPEPNVVTNTALDATLPSTYVAMHEAAGGQPWCASPIQWVITNPPFDQALDILKASYDSVEVGVAMLLRLSFLEPTIKRAEWLMTHKPAAMHVLGSPRPSYTSNGRNDSITTAWMVWLKKDHPLGRSMADSLSLGGINFITNKSKVWGK